MGANTATRYVAITGLMATGKTTVGTAVARRLGWPLRDSDAEIEAREGRTVHDLRDEIGVDAMHELEARHLLDALAGPSPAVVCPAASVADVDACLRALSDPSVVVVLLTVDPDVAAGRFRLGDHRPWYGDDPAGFLALQAEARHPRLRDLDPVEVATDDLSPDEVAEVVLGALAARGVAVPGAGTQ